MKNFNLADYFKIKIRDGESTYKLEKFADEFDEKSDFWICYRHDVYNYYYIVPQTFKNKIGVHLLAFFYTDNEEYSFEQELEFKQKYKEFFKESETL
jgi:hypothetical protein